MGNYVSDAMGFNRTLMELKRFLLKSKSLLLEVVRFNRTLMELKLKQAFRNLKNLGVLIVPLWN